MIQQLNTKAGKLLLIEVPENIDLDTFSLSTLMDIHFLTTDEKDIDIFMPLLPDIEILGKFSELEDKDFEEFVNALNSVYVDYLEVGYAKADYTNEWGCLNAKESFQSLCKSQGIEVDDNYLIIKVL